MMLPFSLDGEIILILEYLFSFLSAYSTSSSSKKHRPIPNHSNHARSLAIALLPHHVSRVCWTVCAWLWQMPQHRSSILVTRCFGVTPIFIQLVHIDINILVTVVEVSLRLVRLEVLTLVFSLSMEHFPKPPSASAKSVLPTQ